MRSTKRKPKLPRPPTLAEVDAFYKTLPQAGEAEKLMKRVISGAGDRCIGRLKIVHATEGGIHLPEGSDAANIGGFAHLEIELTHIGPGHAYPNPNYGIEFGDLEPQMLFSRPEIVPGRPLVAGDVVLVDERAWQGACDALTADKLYDYRFVPESCMLGQVTPKETK